MPLDTRPSLTFSESMEPRSTGDAVAFAPMVEIRQRRWSGRTLTLVLGGTLREGQTYTMFVAPSARDRHGNTMAMGRALVFSTADTFPPGRIEGKIEAKGFAAGGTYLWCYDARRTGVPDSTARDFDALGLAEDDGGFRVDGLHVPGQYRIWAFADLNGNRSFEPQTDVLAPADTLFELTRARPLAAGVRLSIVNPHAPGKVRGTVLDSLPDSLGVVRVLATSESDSTVRMITDAASDGKFELELAAGGWWLRVFRDIDRGRTWQPDRERASRRVRVAIEPAAEVVDIRLELSRRPGEPAKEP